MRVSIATRAADLVNEDYALASSTLAVLLDGGAVPAEASACPHDARWFIRTLGAALLAELGAEPPGWIAEGVARAIDAVATRHAETCEIDDRTHPSAAVAILRQLPDVYEYYILGDATVVFDLAEGEPAARSDKRPRQPDAKRNVRGGYWIASANPDAAARGRQGHVLRGDVRRAALLSDGAAAVVERYDLMDWRSALDLMEKDGPQAVVRAARGAEDATVVFCAPDE